MLDMPEDCSLGQCLTSSRAETSKKKICGLDWGRNDLYYSSVIERPLKLAYFIILFSFSFLDKTIILIGKPKTN